MNSSFVTAALEDCKFCSFGQRDINSRYSLHESYNHKVDNLMIQKLTTLYSGLANFFPNLLFVALSFSAFF